MPTEEENNVRTSSLYDATERLFYPYTKNIAYINPYSSDRNGGELITEYNQRNSLNMLCAKTMDFSTYAEEIKNTLNSVYGVTDTTATPDEITGEYPKKSADLYSFIDTRYADPENWKVTVYATGVQEVDDFNIDYEGTSLKVKGGRAMIQGYNIHCTAEVQLDIRDVITDFDISTVRTRPQQNDSNKIVSKFIKLAVLYVEDGEHDQRLNPPVDDLYPSVAIVVNDELPKVNELLLGTITKTATRSSFGMSNDDLPPTYTITQNPYKTRILPLDVIAGAEYYGDLISSEGLIDKHTYGIYRDSEHPEEGNLRDISEWLWLSNSSNLAKLLKGLSAQPDTATSDDTDKNTRAVITTVGLNDGAGNSNSALRHDTTESFPHLWWYQLYAMNGDADATLEQRTIYYPFAYCRDNVIAKEELPKPEDCPERRYEYTDRYYPELSGRSGRSGFMTPQQAFMLEKAYVYAANRLDAGTQYGPFNTVLEAKDWFAGHHDIEFKLGDYFWVLNDTIQGVTADYGTVTGVVSGNVSGTVTGTISGTGDITGDVKGSVTDTQQEVTGTIESATVTVSGASVTGNVSGTTSGVVTGKWDSFVQNVSTRYSCVYSGPGTSGYNKGVYCITTHAQYVGNTQAPINDGQQTIVDTDGDAWFVLQAAERGFSIPATATSFGLVKAVKEGDVLTVTTPLDIVINSVTGRLNVSKALYNTILNGGYETSVLTEQTLVAGDTLSSYWNKIYTSDSFTIKLTGYASEWEQLSEEQKLLKNLRGHIIIDYSELIVDTNAYGGGSILNLVAVDYVTLKGDNTKVGNHVPTRALKLSFDRCIVDTPFFENIGYWKACSFTSGSNTIELNNPWMTLDKIFFENDYINNKLYTRFSSVTMGEHGITSAMMDMWIQYENTQADNRSVDTCWSTRVRANFPPLMFAFTDTSGSIVTTGNVDQSTIQFIPDDVSMKIGATAGVHEVINAQNANTQQYTVSGNLLATVDWSYNTHYDVNNSAAEQLHLNLYMKNSSGEPMQKISNLKFRVPVQITRATDNSSVYYATYENIYQANPIVVR